MTRGEHRWAKNGCCKRCGLTRHPSSDAMCPPGFWMTKAEAKVWDEATDEWRNAWEREAGAQPARKRYT